MTRYSKNLEGHGSLVPPGYAYARALYITYMQCNTLCKHLRIYIILGPYFLYKNLFIRNFIYSEICTFGLPKLGKISLAFNIFL